MATREIINQRPVMSGVVAVVATVIALGAIFFTRSSDDAYKPAQAYFTVDDGRTYFADDVTRLPPFDRNGQEAVQCYLFRCGETRFVGYLMKLPPPVKQEMEAYAAAGREYPGLNPMAMVKKPGDKEWVSAGSAVGSTLMQVRCPNRPDLIAELVLP